jgi:hypothetical protein
VQARFLREEECGQRDDAAREREPSQPGGNTGRDDDESGGFARRVHVTAAGGKVASDDERDGSRREDNGEPDELPCREPPRQTGQAAKHGVRTDTTEAGGGPARVSRPLAFDADGRPAQCSNGDSQEVPGVSHGVRVLTQTTVYVTVVPNSAPTA